MEHLKLAARFCAALLCAFSAPSFATQSIPSEAFSRLPEYEDLNLSASGNQVAFKRTNSQSQETYLMVYNRSAGKQIPLIRTDNEKSKIRWFNWANENTLVFSVIYASTRGGVDTSETRLLAVDVNVEKPEVRNLIRHYATRSKHFSQFQDRVIDYLPDDPDHILIALDSDTAGMPSVWKLNIYTKKQSRVEKGKRSIRNWITDQQGRVRVGQALDYKSGDATVYVRDTQDGNLEKLFEYNSMEQQPITPVGFGLDPDVLYYRAYLDDKLALYKIDLITKASELVYSDPEYDVDRGLIYSGKTRDVIGIYHRNAPGGRIYWDTSIKNLNASLKKAIPDLHTYLVDFDDTENTYLVYGESDSVPGMYLIGDRKQKLLSFLAGEYPELENIEFPKHQLLTYTARDGMEIEGYLTLPLNAEGPYPTILHPHGGPGARDVAGFDYWTAFFVSRGYAVFRPNFRGSSGYGYNFSQSQMQGWGLAMQDDLTDAVRWLVEQNIADKNKVCIVGASYGGYAALMGAAKTPDLFQCAVSFAGVSDLNQLVFDARNYRGYKLVKNQIGESRKDRLARSPISHIEKISIPILLVHGEKDRIVDVKQSRNMAEELSDENKNVRYVELVNGDHYLSIQRNRHLFFSEMDAFLKTHL